MERGPREACLTVGSEGTPGQCAGKEEPPALLSVSGREASLGSGRPDAGGMLTPSARGRQPPSEGGDLSHTQGKQAGWEEQSGVIGSHCCFPGKTKCCSLHTVAFLLIILVLVLLG